MNRRVMLLELTPSPASARRAVREAVELLLVARLEPGLGGIWTQDEDGIETIRIGFPVTSSHAYFQVMQPPSPGTATCASVALERIAFGRGIGHVLFLEPALVPVVRHCLPAHDLRIHSPARASHASQFSAAQLIPAGASWEKLAEDFIHSFGVSVP